MPEGGRDRGQALDSWANVWLQHQKNKPDSYYQDVLHLAYGECRCHKETTDKGVPGVQVPWTSGSDNIDLFPEGFLWERGCNITRGDDLSISTPKGRKFVIQMWGNMPYVKADQLRQILSDLPDHSQAGRTGNSVSFPKAARVAHVQVDLDHLSDILPVSDLRRIRSKYAGLPDLYYKDQSDAIITPQRFDQLGDQVVQRLSTTTQTKLWEICSGSSALSTQAWDCQISHLPPIDLRYGWYTQRHADQTLLLYGILIVGVTCRSAAPNCAL